MVLMFDRCIHLRTIMREQPHQAFLKIASGRTSLHLRDAQMLEQSLAHRSTILYTFPRTHAHSRLLQFRGPRESAGFRLSGTLNSFYVAYLDEFGHVGPFVGRSHPKHNTSPVFGLGGFVLPVGHVRSFASYFYRLKCNLLAFEIERAGTPAYLWEKRVRLCTRRRTFSNIRSCTVLPQVS
jgi:hypothetical protein